MAFTVNHATGSRDEKLAIHRLAVNRGSEGGIREYGVQGSRDSREVSVIRGTREDHRSLGARK